MKYSGSVIPRVDSPDLHGAHKPEFVGPWAQFKFKKGSIDGFDRCMEEQPVAANLYHKTPNNWKAVLHS